MHTFLAIDPGKTTGYCIGCFVDRRLFIAPGEQKLTHRQFYEFVRELASQVNWHNLDFICESFEFRNANTGVDYYPVELIGVLKWFAEDRTQIRTHWQNSTVQGKKAHFSNDRLKELGIYHRGGDGHARSATKHLMYFITFKAGVPIVGTEPQLQLVEERWLLDAYYGGVDLY